MFLSPTFKKSWEFGDYIFVLHFIHQSRCDLLLINLSTNSSIVFAKYILNLHALKINLAASRGIVLGPPRRVFVATYMYLTAHCYSHEQIPSNWLCPTLYNWYIMTQYTYSIWIAIDAHILGISHAFDFCALNQYHRPNIFGKETVLIPVVY